MPGEFNSANEKNPNAARRGTRPFRLWGKKRGSRQTGSKRWGGTGEAIFFAALFLIGVGALTALTQRAASSDVDAQMPFASGWGLWISVLMLSALVVTGAVGAIYSVMLTGASAERRAAIANRASSIEFMPETTTSPNDYPSVPRDTNWKNSPGICLAYRLPVASSPTWRLVIFAVFCLIWNGVVAVLVVLAIPTMKLAISQMQLNSSVLFVVTYTVIGAILLSYLSRMLINAAAVGPTSVEVSAQPMRPGGTYAVFLSQAGHLNIEWLELALVCDEEVSFSDGTDTRSESRRVYEQLVFRKQAIEIRPSEPFQFESPLDVPQNAMHSFLAPHNAVTWKLAVRAMAKNWPPFEREFPLVVYPGDG